MFPADCRLFKKSRRLTHPTPARGSTKLAEVRDAPFRGQGRSKQLKMIRPSLLVYVAPRWPG